MGDINAFVDHGFSDASTFSKEFLDSPDFTVTALRRILQSGANRSKRELAEEAWSRLHQGTLEPSRVLRYWADQPRRWLSFKLGTPDHFGTSGSAEALVTHFGEEGWHGPVRAHDGSRCWYIHTSRIFHYRFVNNEPRISYIRWPVIADVSEKCIGLSWNNFSFRAQQVIEETDRYPFWQHLPNIFSDLEVLLGGKWRAPVLNDLVLHELWNRYKNDADYRWYHLRIRAERFGVALSARSAGISDLNVAGLEALTRELARAAAVAAKIRDNATIRAMEAELLRTLLLEWGTNSYAFQLDRVGTEGEPNDTLFKSHCYFGLRQTLQSQDRFQHLECWQDAGGSTGALAFLLSAL